MVSLNSIDNCLKCCFSRISLLAYLWQFAIPVKYISANTTFPTLLWMNRCHPYRNTPSRRRFHTRKLCWCSEITGKTRVAIRPILASESILLWQVLEIRGWLFFDDHDYSSEVCKQHHAGVTQRRRKTHQFETNQLETIGEFQLRLVSIWSQTIADDRGS